MAFFKSLTDKSDPMTHDKTTLMETVLKDLGKLSHYPLPVPPEARPWQEISQFLDTLDTLDLVVYSCPISWYSMQLQGGRWTHVGMIYRRDDKYLKHHDWLEPQDDAKVLILESIIGKEEERVSGVDLVDAKKRMEGYFDDFDPEVHKWGRGQYVGFRKLKIERTPELLQAVEREVEKYLGKPYEKNMVELFRALIHVEHSIIPAPKIPADGPDSLFCSELVACVYQGVGLLKKPADGGTPANEFSPCDFASDYSVKHPLEKGELEKEVIFGFPPSDPITPPIPIPVSKLPKTGRWNHKHFREYFGQTAKAIASEQQQLDQGD